MTTTDATATATATAEGPPLPDHDHGHVAPRTGVRRLSSARLRITGWYAALLAVALGLSLLAVQQILLVSLDERIDRDLVQEVEELGILAEEGLDPVDGQPFRSRVDHLFEVFLSRNLPSANETLLTFVDGQPHLRGAGSPPVRLDERPELVARWSSLQDVDRGSLTLEEVGRVEYLAVPVRVEGTPAGVFVVAHFADLERAEVDEVVRVAGLVGLVALAIASLLAWGVASRLLEPVRDLTRTATAITETDLSRRITVEGHDEIAELATTFNGMLDRLSTAFSAQRDFIDDASHELRTPITIIRGNLELLEDDPVERAETIALVLDELDRMNRMVEDLLLLAKAEQPDFLRLETLDLGALTDEIAAKTPALAPRDWRIELRGRGVVVGDRHRLTQAVVQLAQNATQHTGEGATIAIGSAIEGPQARLWVRDTGPGIAPEEQQRIFERFTRAQADRRRSEGAGLGLAIVRAIAEAHRGRLEVASREGDGATFTIVIPVDEPVTE